MRAVLSVAATAFRESIRNRTLLGVLLLAVAFVASALLLAELALDQRIRVIQDWGLFCVTAFGVLLAILMGVSQVHKEVRRKTIYVVLTRPIRRWQYVLGKYLGMAATLILEVLCLSLALAALLVLEGGPVDATLLAALALALLEILLVAAMATFFAAFASPYLSGLFTLGLFVIGRSLPSLLGLADKVESDGLRTLARGLIQVLPDLTGFNLSSQVVFGVPPSPAQVGWSALYGLSYLAALLLLAAAVFSRKDMT
jgi:ABC-type transport system involved in multi-copper enzyme maturation permease subunit